ncbi:serine hydrolase domain-containing protein [Ichthyenterobacterium sp. W332]|uniref:Serine hydrolase domain-containing protein n=1 Tax=Microcosmobacter mediterraneus TaxID=3075607 RepID=A0ABU2YJD7_9FLAO|nr:serine hydrolase domain-containing protein [Ichthyenterobacterium sp. W332]MDT0557173.1 serine hydrolase domain-containing protein [Ichthyenterobacterium sp. W332]
MKEAIRISFFLTLLITFGCGEKKSKPNTDSEKEVADDYSAKIDSLIQTTTPRKFNGVILITQNGEIKYSKEYGYSNFEKKTPISLNENFRIQSNSKQITAVLILKEVEKGNINLQSPIKEYLPDLKQSWADSVAVHQLLNMSSGIITLDKPLAFEPGSDYRYSNAGYGLLGKILKKVSGQNYVELANGLFKDLGMNNSYCYEFGENQQDLINGYLNSSNGYELVDFYSRGITTEGWQNFIPTGGIISNAIDLNIWDHQLHNGKILKPKSYELMTNYNIKGPHAAFGTEKIGYGYGVRIDDSEVLKVIGHAGKGIGFANIKFSVPDKQLNVIVLENVYDEDPNIVYHFEKEIREIVLKSIFTKQ